MQNLLAVCKTQSVSSGEDKADKMAVMKRSEPRAAGWCWGFRFHFLGPFSHQHSNVRPCPCRCCPFTDERDVFNCSSPLFSSLANTAAWLMRTDRLTDCSVPLCSPLFPETSQVSWISPSLPLLLSLREREREGMIKRGRERTMEGWEGGRLTEPWRHNETEINFDF